jgi:hypothetical protein
MQRTKTGHPTCDSDSVIGSNTEKSNNITFVPVA